MPSNQGLVTPAIRKMLVVRTPCTNSRPMIRISNQMLADMGFEIGMVIEVSYDQDIIIIKKQTS